MRYTLCSGIGMSFIYTKQPPDNLSLTVIEIGHSNPRHDEKKVSIYPDCWHLHYVTHGSGLYNGAEIRAGQGFLVAPGKVYCELARADGFEQYWINFTGADVSGMLLRAGIPEEPHIFDCDRTPEGRRLIESSFAEAFATDIRFSGTRMYLAGLLYKLLSVHEGCAGPAGIICGYAERVRDYIHAHYAEKLSVAQLAAMTGLSPKYLSRVFHSATGCTLAHYISEVRLDMARLMLTYTDKSVGDIAHEAGFADALYFSKVFRSSAGQTPSEFRAGVQRSC